MFVKMIHYSVYVTLKGKVYIIKIIKIKFDPDARFLVFP